MSRFMPKSNEDTFHDWDRLKALNKTFLQILSVISLPLKQYAHLRDLIPAIQWASLEMNTNSTWYDLPLVYARFNLQCTDVYIGSTKSFDKRFEDHTRETSHHYVGHTHTCKEPFKYGIHGQFQAHSWVMMPIILPPSPDLDNTEKRMIKRFGTMNKRIAHGKYNTQIFHRMKLKVDHNFHEDTPRVQSLEFWVHEGSRYADLNRLFRSIQSSNLPTLVQYVRGSYGVTNWRTFTQKYGDNTVSLAKMGNTPT